MVELLNLLTVVFKQYPEAATGGVLQKNVLLKILQISQENTCVRVSFK